MIQRFKKIKICLLNRLHPFPLPLTSVATQTKHKDGDFSKTTKSTPKVKTSASISEYHLFTYAEKLGSPPAGKSRKKEIGVVKNHHGGKNILSSNLSETFLNTSQKDGKSTRIIPDEISLTKKIFGQYILNIIVYICICDCKLLFKN